MREATGDIRLKKRELRAYYRSLRENMDPEKKRAEDAAILARLVSAPFYRDAETVLCFVSTRLEVETHGFLRQCLAEGKRVAVPKCLDEKGSMDFFLIRDFDDLSPASFGLLEPDPARAERLCGYGRSLCVLPAFAFDRDGFRIGFGKGYYDRFLQRYNGVKAGVCYSCCMGHSLPRGRYDAAADYVVTPKYILTVKKPGRDGRR